MDDEHGTPIGLESKAERARQFAADMAMQAYALLAAADEGLRDGFRGSLMGAELDGHFEGDRGAGLGLRGGLGALESHFHDPFSSSGPLGRCLRGFPFVGLAVSLA
jgi:hypothetical protein